MTRIRIKNQKPVKEIGLLQFSDHTVGKTTHVACAVPPLGIDSERFSSLIKMFGVTALALRFISRIRNKDYFKGPILNGELDIAEKTWLLNVQRKNFSEVYESIISKGSNTLQRQLGLYIE